MILIDVTILFIF